MTPKAMEIRPPARIAMSREEQSPPPAPRPRSSTVLESVEEIRAQIARPAPTSGTPRSASELSSPAEGADDTQPYRPAMRPSMALLTVLDDGEESGEVIRIRGDSFLIARVYGALVIPHDPGISGRHASIVRSGECRGRWRLIDLESTNGTFVRASSGLLGARQEFLI